MEKDLTFLLESEDSGAHWKTTREVFKYVENLAEETGKPVYFEKVPGKRGSVEVGTSWVCPQEKLQEGESIRLTTYTNEGKKLVHELLSQGIEDLSEPIGHIEAMKQTDGASIAAMIYMFEWGGMAARLDFKLTGEETLSESSEQCFEFANKLGIGAEWTRFMFGSNEGDNRVEGMVEIQESQATQLYEFLNTLGEQV